MIKNGLLCDAAHFLESIIFVEKVLVEFYENKGAYVLMPFCMIRRIGLSRFHCDPDNDA